MMFANQAPMSGRLNSRSLKALCFIAALASTVSCSAPAVTGFSWHDQSSATLSFSESSSWPIGEEGRFSDSRNSNRYILSKPQSFNEGLAVEVNILRIGASADKAGGASGPARVNVALAAKPDGTSIFATASFPLLAGKVSLLLPINAGSRLASLLVTREGNGPAFSVESIGIVPSFKGIESGPSSIKVSTGFSLVQAGAFHELSIRRPFASLGPDGSGNNARRPGILLDYGAAPKGTSFRLETKMPNGSLRSYNLRSRPSGARTVLDENIVPADAELVTLRVPAAVEVRAFYAAELPPQDYRLADLGRVLLAPSPAGDYSIYRWDLIPSVLIFDFKDYATQDRYLKRLAFFVEKVGYRGILAKDEDIAVLHGWNAHDYRAEDLAAFFRAAKEKSFPLGAGEKELQDLLVGAGIINKAGGELTAGTGALISIARESNASLRWTFAVHESMHAVFFTDSDYRSFARSAWASLDSDEKWFWKTYFNWAGYDAGSDYLMGNEFQAYLLQQPSQAAEEYFSKRKTAELLEKHAELQERVDEYMAKYQKNFQRRASQLESWLYAKYGIEAGRSVFLTPLR